MQMNTSQQVTATLVVTKADGTPGVLDGIPVWASSDPTQATAVASADGMTCVFAAVAPSPAGSSVRLTVDGDADLGAGSLPLIGVSEDVTISQDPATQASTMTITFGAPVPKA